GGHHHRRLLHRVPAIREPRAAGHDHGPHREAQPARRARQRPRRRRAVRLPRSAARHPRGGRHPRRRARHLRREPWPVQVRADDRRGRGARVRGRARGGGRRLRPRRLTSYATPEDTGARRAVASRAAVTASAIDTTARTVWTTLNPTGWSCTRMTGVRTAHTTTVHAASAVTQWRRRHSAIAASTRNVPASSTKPPLRMRPAQTNTVHATKA